MAAVPAKRMSDVAVVSARPLTGAARVRPMLVVVVVLVKPQMGVVPESQMSGVDAGFLKMLRGVVQVKTMLAVDVASLGLCADDAEGVTPYAAIVQRPVVMLPTAIIRQSSVSPITERLLQRAT